MKAYIVVSTDEASAEKKNSMSPLKIRFAVS